MLVLLLYLCLVFIMLFCFFFKQKTAYEMRISDWSSDVCSSDLLWRLFDDEKSGEGEARDAAIDRKLHQTIAGVAEDIEALSFNKAVAKLYALVGLLEKAQPSASRAEAKRTLMHLLAPLVPHGRSAQQPVGKALGRTLRSRNCTYYSKKKNT